MWCCVSFTVREVRFVLPFPCRGFSLLREGKYTCRGGPYNRSWASWIKVHPLGFSGCGGAREWQLHGPTVSFLCLSGSEMRLWCVLLLLPSPETGDSLDRSARTPLPVHRPPLFGLSARPLRPASWKVDPDQAEGALAWARTCPDPVSNRQEALAAVRELATRDWDVQMHIEDRCFLCGKSGHYARDCPKPLLPEGATQAQRRLAAEQATAEGWPSAEDSLVLYRKVLAEEKRRKKEAHLAAKKAIGKEKRTARRMERKGREKQRKRDALAARKAAAKAK